MINSVIFDLDGTLLNSLDDLADSTNYTLRTAGYRKGRATRCAGLSETVYISLSREPFPQAPIRRK